MIYIYVKQLLESNKQQCQLKGYNLLRVLTNLIQGLMCISFMFLVEVFNS